MQSTVLLRQFSTVLLGQLSANYLNILKTFNFFQPYTCSLVQCIFVLGTVMFFLLDICGLMGGAQLLLWQFTLAVRSK